MERIYCPAYSFEDLCEICRKADIKEATTWDPLNMSRYRKPFTQELVGKAFPCRFDDGSRLLLRFPEVNKVLWSEDGEVFHEEYCEPLKSTAGNVIGVHFLRRAMLPFEAAFVVIDMDSGYATWVQMTLGAHNDEKYVFSQPHFGEVDGLGDRRGEKHHFAADLVGKSIDWTYNERMTLRHSYVTPYLMYVPHLPERGKECSDNEDFIWHRFCKGFHAKIRDDLYLVTFTEDGNRGAALLIDTKRLHDIGGFYGITHDGRLSCLTLTARGGWGGVGLKEGAGFAKPLFDED